MMKKVYVGMPADINHGGKRLGFQAPYQVFFGQNNPMLSRESYYVALTT